ncbi:hypothetical protein RJ639_027928 [Escallonia herrerae]|uniref:Retrotransposon gag domain-containing protein n=1 Tax=Escallonia herrerae TaxID=1293975 RepID=A0AA89BDD9_9ASTE|nr:hypothetical protein RJ639_027928 [Escallonia herrerae]
MPEPRLYDGAREARQVDYFFWHLERYFEARDIVEEEEKVQWTIASQVELIFNRLDDLKVDSRLTMLEWKVVFAEELDDLIEEKVAHFTKWDVQRCKDLKGQVKELQEELAACKMELQELRGRGLSRRRYTDGCDVKMWENFKSELKMQFYSESAEDMTMINLQRLRQKGGICEYVKEYSALMLEISEISERQRLCFFIDGLQQWVAIEFWRREPHDLASAMAIIERLKDFKKGERLRSPTHERAKDGGDGRLKSCSPKATDDEQSGDKGHRHHRKGKKHEESHKQGDSRDHKAHGRPRGGCFYCASSLYGRYCLHKGNMLHSLRSQKTANGIIPAEVKGRSCQREEEQEESGLALRNDGR